MFFNSFDENVRKIFKEDIDKYLVISWIIFNANYQEEYDGLGRYECYFSFSVVEKYLKLGHKKASKIIKELVEDKHIEWVKKSTNQYQKSIIKLVVQGTSKCTTKCTTKGTSRETDNKEIERILESANTLASAPARNTLSKNISKNLSNQCVYISYPQAPHVELTEEQLCDLVQEHGIEYIDGMILDLENEIVNGDGAKYKDHNLLIRSWIRYRQSLKAQKAAYRQAPQKKAVQQTSQQVRTKPKKQERFTNIAQHNWDFEKLEQAEWLHQQLKLGNITPLEYEEGLKELS